MCSCVALFTACETWRISFLGQQHFFCLAHKSTLCQNIFCTQAGRDIYDLGESLYAFLLRYGEEFDYETEAVSVASGGIVSKRVRVHFICCLRAYLFVCQESV